MRRKITVSNSVTFKMDTPSNWSVSFIGGGDSVCVGMIFGDKETFTHSTILTADEWREINEVVTRHLNPAVR